MLNKILKTSFMLLLAFTMIFGLSSKVSLAIGDGSGKATFNLIATADEINAYTSVMGETIYVYVNDNQQGKTYKLPLEKSTNYVASFDMPSSIYEVVDNPDRSETDYETKTDTETFTVEPSSQVTVEVKIKAPSEIPNDIATYPMKDGGAELSHESSEATAEAQTQDNNQAPNEGQVQTDNQSQDGSNDFVSGDASQEQQGGVDEAEESSGFHLTFGMYIVIGCVLACIGLFAYHKIRG